MRIDLTGATGGDCRNAAVYPPEFDNRRLIRLERCPTCPCNARAPAAPVRTATATPSERPHSGGSAEAGALLARDVRGRLVRLVVLGSVVGVTCEHGHDASGPRVDADRAEVEQVASARAQDS